MYALVTGASAGIGMEMAKYLGTLGYDLILSARSEDRLEQTRRVILARYSDRSVHLLPADLSNREECFRLYREACALAGNDGISFVANNAGMGVYGLFLETDLEKELDLIDLNVTSVHTLPPEHGEKRPGRPPQRGILRRFHGRPYLLQLLRLQKLRSQTDRSDPRRASQGRIPRKGLLPLPGTDRYCL